MVASGNAKLVKQYVDFTFMFRYEDIVVECKVTDVKQAYGVTLLLVEPTHGTGQQWVSESRIETPIEAINPKGQ